MGPASDGPVRVDENGDAGWQFNPDADNATPYEFNRDAHSIGTGSLYVEPIANNPDGRQKFIGALPLGVEVADLDSIAYDFRIAGTGTASDANEFYLNVYTNVAGSSSYYDCRFDFSPSSGSTGSFTDFTVTPTTVASGTGGTQCPSAPKTLSGMPEGSTISAIALNVGDTSSHDEGLAGYYDNVRVSVAGTTTTYDFEATPSDKSACKKGGWADFGFGNQGQCVSAVQSNDNAGK